MKRNRGKTCNEDRQCAEFKDYVCLPIFFLGFVSHGAHADTKRHVEDVFIKIVLKTYMCSTIAKWNESRMYYWGCCARFKG